MNMQRTMEMKEMQFIHDEMVKLSQPVLPVNANATPGMNQLSEAYEHVETEFKVVKIAKTLLNMYKGYVDEGTQEEATANYGNFIDQVESELARGRFLNAQNYKSLLMVVTTLAFNTHTLKMTELISTGYWEGITIEDFNQQAQSMGLETTNE